MLPHSIPSTHARLHPVGRLCTGFGAYVWLLKAGTPACDSTYVANRNADVFVLRASPKFECLATNPIGGEPMNASPAISDGNIFIRTDKQLWRIGNKKE